MRTRNPPSQQTLRMPLETTLRESATAHIDCIESYYYRLAIADSTTPAWLRQTSLALFLPRRRKAAIRKAATEVERRASMTSPFTAANSLEGCFTSCDWPGSDLVQQFPCG